MGHGGHGANVERLGVGSVDGVAGAQQAPVKSLDFPAHASTLPHQWRALSPAPSTISLGTLFNECGQAGLVASAAAFRSLAVRSNIAPKSGNDFAIKGSIKP